MSKHFTQQKKTGYMLIEIMVSLSIFTLIAVSTTAALLAIIDANSKSQSLRSVIDNLNVAVENMARTIRIGTDYRCVPNPASDPIGRNDTATCAANTTGTIGIS